MQNTGSEKQQTVNAKLRDEIEELKNEIAQDQLKETEYQQKIIVLEKENETLKLLSQQN